MSAGKKLSSIFQGCWRKVFCWRGWIGNRISKDHCTLEIGSGLGAVCAGNTEAPCLLRTLLSPEFIGGYSVEAKHFIRMFLTFISLFLNKRSLKFFILQINLLGLHFGFWFTSALLKSQSLIILFTMR